ncbi:EAL domain-containing protein [Ideonella sp. 4Y16]|uniref:EAL domain-containing protein n=1 Tax=Ideonella alba TaxID=2824118 RepID=A0A940YH19_9BURK|nr:GGDEF and EAL domain-containing protein [Ideonella alba]MBQ0932322.1 EAL domain-containing protein [Ideonella alba]MBQ0944472.1 EAL domain-containing protein [Ideonella alba]
MTTSSPAPRPPADPGGWLARFHAQHLPDYSPASTRLWWAIALSGALALGIALDAFLGWPAERQMQVVGALALVVTAALLSLQLPRTSFSFSIADAFNFTLLVMYGPAAAVLGAGAEGLVGTMRTSRRLSSRVASPAAAMASWSLAGAAHAGLAALLVVSNLPPAVAEVLALLLASLVTYVGTTLPLMAMMTLKRQQWPAPRSWLNGTAWVGGVYIGSALLAAMAWLLARQHGAGLMALLGVAVLGVLALVRVTLAHQEAEHARQEQCIDEARREAELNQQRFSAAFTHAAVGMAIADAQGRLLRVNQALATLVQAPEGTLPGRTMLDLLHPADHAVFERKTLEMKAHARNDFALELRCRTPTGGDTWVMMHCGRFADPGGEGNALIYQLHDVSARRAAEARLQHIAYHDNLTGLANRARFHEQLEGAVERSLVDPQVYFAVMFLDLDRFKIVNDSLGHEAGNLMLREVARRLQSCVRPSDLVARLGGDEFAVMLLGLQDSADGLRLARRMLAELMQPMPVCGTELVPGASLGITFSDLGYRTVDELLRDADVAMYEAKAGGRGRVAIFDRTMHERIAYRLALEADLRRALAEQQLSLVYQPLYEIEGGRLTGFEALARWHHPVRGAVSPAEFIALAEESGHIETLTTWLIGQAVAQMAQWHRLAPHLAQASMHLNLSGRDLVRSDIVDTVRDALQRHGLPPARLTLEITETVLMERLDLALETVRRLRELGVRLSIDDFGTGYSSLSYLGTLPIDSLKIDRSFVMRMEQQPESIEIVRAVVTLGHALGKRVIAEGVETAAQLEQLRQLGADEAQGYLLSRPVTAAEVPRLLYAPALA